MHEGTTPTTTRTATTFLNVCMHARASVSLCALARACKHNLTHARTCTQSCTHQHSCECKHDGFCVQYDPNVARKCAAIRASGFQNC